MRNGVGILMGAIALLLAGGALVWYHNSTKAKGPSAPSKVPAGAGLGLPTFTIVEGATKNPGTGGGSPSAQALANK